MEVVKSLIVDTALYTATKAGEGGRGTRTYGTHVTKTTADIPISVRHRTNSRTPTAALDRKAPSSSRPA
jgi:hypothetical protein